MIMTDEFKPIIRDPHKSANMLEQPVASVPVPQPPSDPIEQVLSPREVSEGLAKADPLTRHPRVSSIMLSVVFGLLLLLIVFAQAKSFSTPTLTDFMDGCPYQGENALQVGDTIWSIDGHRIYFTTNVSEYLARGGDTHDIVVKRDGEKVALNDFYLVAREYPGQDGKMYGFYFGTRPATFGAKLQTTWYSAMDFVRMAWMGLSDLFAGAVGVKDLSGPVGIVSMMNEVGKESATKAAAFSNIAYFSAFIAVNLAVMNMLPLPALDGGRVFCLLVTWVLERISRRKIDPKYEGYIHTAGLVLLLALMAYVMYNDISKLVT